MQKIVYSVNLPCWEKNPRKGSLQPMFLRHRFPIKNGLTYFQVLKFQPYTRSKTWGELVYPQDKATNDEG